MTGCNHKDQSIWGYRNHFESVKEGSDFLELKKMKESGYVTEGRSSYDIIYFYITKKGCEAIGMTKSQIKRAMKD